MIRSPRCLALKFLGCVLAALLAAACQTASGAGGARPAVIVAQQPPVAEAQEAAPEEETREPEQDAVQNQEATNTEDVSLIEAEEAEAREQVPVEDTTAESKVDAAELHRQALDACDSAVQFLDEGSVEDAISALDRAYELMLMLPESNGGEGHDGRDELRLLIAERLLQVYASQRTAAALPKINWDLEIPLVDNAQVQREIKSFQTAERATFLAAYRRSGRYRPLILAKLDEAGLPSQLSWLPLIESEFKVRALSRAGAYGMWQFIRSTGQRFGLRRDTWVDERLDPVKATDAAIAYLTELHDMFGDWPKALAGYNCGELRVARLDRRDPAQDLDFWDLYAMLPRETRRYIPRFFATLLILEDPAKYGFELPEPDAPMPESALVTTTKSYRLSDLDEVLGLKKGTVAELNPELRKKATPNRSYELRIPAPGVDDAATRVASLREWTPPRPEYVTYRVRRGDTLSRIARRFGTSSTAIARLNGIRNKHRIGTGKILKVPVGRSYVASSTTSSTPSPPTAVATSGEPITYTVKRGDTLYHIAKLYRTTVGRLKSDNGLRSSRLYPKQKLKVRPGTREGQRYHVVRRGDTPIEIARAYRVSLNALLRINGLGRRSTIYPGQTLVIPD